MRCSYFRAKMVQISKSLSLTPSIKPVVSIFKSQQPVRTNGQSITYALKVFQFLHQGSQPQEGCFHEPSLHYQEDKGGRQFEGTDNKKSRWMLNYCNLQQCFSSFKHLGILSKFRFWGTFLVAQWVRLCAPNAGGVDSIPGRWTKIPHAVWCSQNKRKK